ncbi:alpha/beta hydrolase [Niabella beijingensis]|uniref:alpha/beta hydrolase n=1 Tax=Niabella beijingensis TaxID=2872700 RepID=UPI001CBE53DA|nr:alpha/beta hydrolase [Niabella beijingensis]
MICLHGFNESARSFSVLKNPDNRYTFLMIDAPFHGSTNWQQGLHYTPDNLHEIINNILKAEGFSPEQQLIFVGFSLGGRMSLSYYQHYPHTISRLILLAPDGLALNCWYGFSAYTRAGNRLFYLTMKYPQWLIKLAGILSRLGFINPGIKKFVTHYLHAKEVRQTLYNSWTAFRFFKPDIAQIKKIIAANKTPVQLYFGKYDRVIPAARGIDFIKGIEAYAKTTALETGHRLLQDRTVQALFENT